MMLTMNLTCCFGVLLLLVVLLVFPIGQTNGYLHRQGRHVCTNPQAQPAPKQMFIESYCQPVFKPYFAMCDGGFRLCTRYRTIYSQGYRYRYSQNRRQDVGYQCCPGWRTINRYASSCTEPVCTTPCRNGGRCIGPDTCSCTEGWTGRQCEQAICATACKNNGRCVGPNTCTCPRGWGGSLCTKAVCFSECQNSGECVGPDMCACPSGWTGKYCEEDLNECETDYHECQQTCKNTNGSFTCTCHEGFILRMDGKTCQVCLLCSPEFQELAGRVVELEKNLEEMRDGKKEDGAKRPADEGMMLIDMALNDQHISQIGRIASLSDQISMLEERLDECTCTYQNGYSRQQPRRRTQNKIKKKR